MYTHIIVDEYSGYDICMYVYSSAGPSQPTRKPGDWFIFNFHQCYGFKLKNIKVFKKSCGHGEGRTAEWNDLKFCGNN